MSKLVSQRCFATAELARFADYADELVVSNDLMPTVLFLSYAGKHIARWEKTAGVTEQRLSLGGLPMPLLTNGEFTLSVVLTAFYMRGRSLYDPTAPLDTSYTYPGSSVTTQIVGDAFVTPAPF